MDDPLTYGIKTDAGREMLIYFNQYYGSSIWGKIKDGIIAIENEIAP